MTFQIRALDHHRFAKLFALSDSELAANMAVRQIATTKPGFPCRVSLADAEVGEELILVNYEHQPSASPYRAAHAVSCARESSRLNLRSTRCQNFSKTGRCHFGLLQSRE